MATRSVTTTVAVVGDDAAEYDAMLAWRDRNADELAARGYVVTVDAGSRTMSLEQAAALDPLPASEWDKTLPVRPDLHV